MKIIRQKQITISNRVNISIEENYIFISPKSDVSMNKEFKEKCRVKKIPKNIRAYMFENSIEPKDLMI